MRSRKFISFALALVLLAFSIIPVQIASAATRLPFTDVSRKSWYYHAVSVCWTEKILIGVSDTKFEPASYVTREMAAQIIYRIAGGEPVDYEPIYDDVPENKWYTDAILWDTREGLARGVRGATATSGPRFGVGELTTREQIMTFLYRLEGRPATTGDASVYADANQISLYAMDAMIWAAEEHILVGDLSHWKLYLRPRDNCTRAELAQILLRYLHPEERIEYTPPEPPETTPEPPPDTVPIYSQTPLPLTGKATINGVRVPQLYGSTANVPVTAALLQAGDLVRFWSDAAVSTTDSDGTYSCTVRLGGKSFQYTDGVGGAVYDGTDWYLPCRDFPKAFGYSEYLDSKENHVFYTPLPNVNAIPSGRSVPVLMYHAVGEPFSGGIPELFVTKASLEAQLNYIKQNGFSAIGFEDLPRLSSYRKPVILTFDDGYLDNYTILFPLLKKYNLKATIFIFPNNIGKNRNFLTWDMVREMSDSGLVSFQSHTMSHSNLDSLSAAQQQTELAESKRIITEKTGKECFVLCFPSGKYNNTTLQLARQYYRFALKMNGNLYVTVGDPYRIPRYYVSRYTSLTSFIGMITH